MKVYNNILLILFAVVAGYVGGHLNPTGQIAHAQTVDVTHEILKTKELQIVDNSGNLRSTIRVNPDDSVNIVLFDKHHIPRSSLALGPDGSPILYLKDSSSKTRAALSVTTNNPGLFVYDENGITRGGIAMSGGAAEIGTMDSKGKSRCVLTTKQDGTPALVLLSASGKPQGGFVAASNGATALELYDSTGFQRAMFGLESDNVARLAFYDPKSQNIRGAFGMESDGSPLLVLVGANGDIVTSFP